MKRLAICVAATAIVAGCAPRAAPPIGPAAVTVDPNNPLFAPGYMATAASGDQFEIQSSQLALQMSQNPAVRSFAQMLINDHTRMTQQMAATAQSAGLMAPAPVLLPQHQAMLDQLRAAPMGTFDMAFRNAQINAHQQALALHQNYAASGDVPALRTLAAGAVPAIQGHLNMAQSLNVMAAPPPPMPPQRRAGERG
jgi:putative membrane protein